MSIDLFHYSLDAAGGRSPSAVELLPSPTPWVEVPIDATRMPRIVSSS
jgi:hypothetical protein